MHIKRIGKRPLLQGGGLRAWGFESPGVHQIRVTQTSRERLPFLRSQEPAEPNRCGSPAVTRIARGFESLRLDHGVGRQYRCAAWL